jgi:hypothetical protein
MPKDEGIVDGAKLGGHFGIGEGRTVLGDLSLRGRDTLLYLHDSEPFFITPGQPYALHGVLHNRTKVTVIGSSVRSSMGSVRRLDEHFHFTELLPAFVVSGDHHLEIETPTISRIGFHVDDAEEIFYDFDALGHVIDARPIIDQVVKENERRIDRTIATGPAPEIVYFAGRIELANIETVIGQVRIFHDPLPSGPLSSPRFVAIQNRTLVEIAFPELQLLQPALDRLMSLRRFLGMIAGRPQNIDALWLETVEDDQPRKLEVYWTRSPGRATLGEEQHPHASEILVSAIHDHDEFCTTLQHWLAAEPELLEARIRFADGFDQQRWFPIDRLVGSANMFDILPTSLAPAAPALAETIAAATDVARKAFKALPDSPERQSILGALGRLGRPTLRSKVRHRAGIVSAALSKPLTDLDLVTDEAVKCRNFYVHGSEGSFSYAEHLDVRVFLTGALECLFAASDLIEAGWDIARWRANGSVMAHPFNRVLHEWDHYAARIRTMREEAKVSPDGP